MAATHRITISLTPEQNEELMRVAAAHGFSKSEAVRAMIKQFLENRDRENMFNPNASLKGRKHTRNHSGDVRGNPRSDALIANFKDEEDDRM